jgi:hypothetical protein
MSQSQTGIEIIRDRQRHGELGEHSPPRERFDASNRQGHERRPQRCPRKRCACSKLRTVGTLAALLELCLRSSEAQTQSRLLEQMRLERRRGKAFADTGSPVKSHAFPVGIDFLAATQPRPDLLFAPDQRACDGRVQAAFTTFSSCPTLRAVVSNQK